MRQHAIHFCFIPQFCESLPFARNWVGASGCPAIARSALKTWTLAPAPTTSGCKGEPRTLLYGLHQHKIGPSRVDPAASALPSILSLSRLVLEQVAGRSHSLLALSTKPSSTPIASPRRHPCGPPFSGSGAEIERRLQHASVTAASGAASTSSVPITRQLTAMAASSPPLQSHDPVLSLGNDARGLSALMACPDTRSPSYSAEKTKRLLVAAIAMLSSKGCQLICRIFLLKSI